MPRYRTVIYLLALAALLAWPSSALAAESAPSFEPFAGDWSGHGRMLTVNPDGTATYSARTYQWCDDVGGRAPCDSIRDGVIVYGTEARLVFTRVDGRAAHGFAIWLGDPSRTAPEPVSLTEGDFGIGYLLTVGTATTPSTAPAGIPLCRQRVLDDAPPSIGGFPCGA